MKNKYRVLVHDQFWTFDTVLHITSALHLFLCNALESIHPS